MKQMLFGVLLLTTFLNIFVVIQETHNKRPEIKLEKIQKETFASPSKNLIIEEVNRNNEAVKNLICEDVEVVIWENGHRFRLRGKIAYEKPTGFRMEISSVFGKELDLGSNKKQFWYWSRRDRRPGLYWAFYEDFNKTRLKTPFNPMFMRSTLGLEVLAEEKINEDSEKVMATHQEKDSMGKPIFYSVFVDKKTKQIDGFLITDTIGTHLVECEIQERDNDIPVKIIYTWNEEKRTMSMHLKNPKINTPIPQNYFLMPEYLPKINMADE